MRREERVRYQLFLPKAVSQRFEALADKPGASKSSILATALTTFLDRRGASEIEEQFATRLNRMSGQLARLERNSHVELESLALFNRYMLAVNAPLTEEEEVARAIGRDRIASIDARVGQQLASGRRTFDPDAPE